MQDVIDNLYDDLSKLDFTKGDVPLKKWIVIHHSLTPDHGVKGWDEIRKYHMSWRYDGNTISEDSAKDMIAKGVKGVEEPWDDIGYNFGIVEANGVSTFVNGHSLYTPGTHAIGFNTNGIGICVEGNYQTTRPERDKWDLAALACMYIRKVWYDKLKVNIKVIGHRETYPLLGVPVVKDCPGSAFNMDDFRACAYGTKTSDQIYGNN